MRDQIDFKHIYAGGILLLAVGIVIILIAYSFAPAIDSQNPVYDNEELITEFTYSGEPLDVWVQYNILRENNMFSYEKVSEPIFSHITLSKGAVKSVIPITLEPGKYKIFMYVLENESPNKRISGFIKYLEI